METIDDTLERLNLIATMAIHKIQHLPISENKEPINDQEFNAHRKFTKYINGIINWVTITKLVDGKFEYCPLTTILDPTSNTILIRDICSSFFEVLRNIKIDNKRVYDIIYDDDLENYIQHTIVELIYEFISDFSSKNQIFMSSIMGFCWNSEIDMLKKFIFNAIPNALIYNLEFRNYNLMEQYFLLYKNWIRDNYIDIEDIKYVVNKWELLDHGYLVIDFAVNVATILIQNIFKLWTPYSKVRDCKIDAAKKYHHYRGHTPYWYCLWLSAQKYIDNSTFYYSIQTNAFPETDNTEILEQYQNNIRDNYL